MIRRWAFIKSFHHKNFLVKSTTRIILLNPNLHLLVGFVVFIYFLYREKSFFSKRFCAVAAAPQATLAMVMFNWLSGKVRPPPADDPRTSSRDEVLASYGEAANSTTAHVPEAGPSQSSSTVPVQVDATKATVSFAPSASDSQVGSAKLKTSRRLGRRVPNIDPLLAGESSRNSDLRPLTPFPTTARTTPIRGGPVPRDDFNEYKKEMESMLQEANTRTSEVQRQLWEMKQRHEREILDWQQRLDSMSQASSSSRFASVQQQTPPSERREPVDIRGDQNSAASPSGSSSLSSHTNLPFKLRKLSTELVLARAEACMMLREWDEMERRSQEAWAMASDLHYEPLTARCQFFLAIAFYGQEKWALASDALEFAKPCVHVYTTPHELDAWRQKIDSVMEMSPAPSITSRSNTPPRGRARRRYNVALKGLGNIYSPGSSPDSPSIHSIERMSNIGWDNTGHYSSGGSTAGSTVHPNSSAEELPPSIHGGESESQADVQGSEVAYDPPQPMINGKPPPTLVTPDISVSVRPRRSRLYTPGDDHSYPSNPLRQGPRLNLVIPIKIFPGSRPSTISTVELRPSRIYMPDNPDVALYPQKPFRQGERLKVVIPSPPPGPPPREVSPSPSPPAFKLVGYHTMPTHSPVLPPPTPASFSSSSGIGGTGFSHRHPVLPPPTPASFSSSSGIGGTGFSRRHPPTNRTQGLRIANPDFRTADASESRRDHASFSDSIDEGKAPWHHWHTEYSPPFRSQATQAANGDFSKPKSSSSAKVPVIPSSPSKPLSSSSDGWGQENPLYARSPAYLGRTGKLRVVNNTGSVSVSEGSLDELTQYIQELSQPVPTQRLRVVNRTPPAFESSHGRPPPLPPRPGGLRVVNRTSPASESSSDRSPPLPKRPGGLRVVNRNSTSESGLDRSPPLPDQPGLGPGLQVVNRTSKSEISLDRSPYLPDSLGIRVVDRRSTSGSSPAKRPPVPNRPGALRVVNRASATPENSCDDPSWWNAHKRVNSTGEAIWFPDTGSGHPRFVESPKKYPNGLFHHDVIHNDTETEVTIEIDECLEKSVRPDVRKMVWRPPSPDSVQPQGKDMQERDAEGESDSSDGADNTEFVRMLGLGVDIPIDTLRRGVRVSRYRRSPTPEDDQLEDYIQESSDEGRGAHSGVQRVRRNRNGELVSDSTVAGEDDRLWYYIEESEDEDGTIRRPQSGVRGYADWRTAYANANASSGKLSADDSFSGSDGQQNEDEETF